MVSAAHTESGIQALILGTLWHEACRRCVSRAMLPARACCMFQKSERVLLATVQKKVRIEDWVDSLGEDIHSRLGITGGNQNLPLKCAM